MNKDRKIERKLLNNVYETEYCLNILEKQSKILRRGDIDMYNIYCGWGGGC